MKIKSVFLQNFGSYKSLDFDFSNQGLTLIAGATGSGKSTLMDAIPWILYGKTAKGGTADEICSWNNQGFTNGVVRLDGGITISRSRNPNDLWFCSNPAYGLVSDPDNHLLRTRGKDLRDTQKLIDDILGVDYDTYLSGAYFHEFSQTAQFFNTTAKNRRQICEQIVDLSLPKTLQEKLSFGKKELRNELDAQTLKIRTYQSEINLLKQLQTSEGTKAQKWEDSHKSTLTYVSQLYDKFEASRKRIMSKQCKMCNTILEHPHEFTDLSENPHIDRLASLKAETNPYQGNIKDFTSDINKKLQEHASVNELTKATQHDFQDLETLEMITEAFRSTLISNTVSHIQDNTNKLLTKHFDAEIQVSFTSTDNDKLEVEIQKDGNTCSFTQLSKGQRQILKLCFGVAVMNGVANHKGVSFNQLFFDEFADGMDDSFKVKSFDLLQELALKHNNVYAIDHSEGFKSLFTNKIIVEIDNGISTITHS